MQTTAPNRGTFFGSRTGLLQVRSLHRQVGRSLAVQVQDANCLIVNTKGGGHAFLGLHLAKKLLSQGHNVTILNDGDRDKLAKKAPFSEYPYLRGAEIVWGNPTNPSTYPQGRFDVVVDNNGKDLDTCRPLIDWAKDNRVRNFLFVGSAGAYKADDVEPMHMEGDPRKSSAGHVAVEQYLEQQRLPYTVFQPLYIYGPHTAKDCEQWFMDRILRDRPVPIPGPGTQLTSLSHVEDLADMMSRVPGNWRAEGEHFNLCSDRCISFDGIVRAIAAAAGKEAKIVHYDPDKVGLKKGEGFPFRPVHFFASSDKAKRVLGWKPAHNFLDDVDQLVRDYKASGRLNKEVDFSVDDKILASVQGGKAPAPAGGNGKAAVGGDLKLSPEQQEFLARKQAEGKPMAAPATASPARGRTIPKPVYRSTSPAPAAAAASSSSSPASLRPSSRPRFATSARPASPAPAAAAPASPASLRPSSRPRFASSARPASPAPAPAAAAPANPAASLRPSSRPRFASSARPASPAPAAAPASPAASLRPSSRPRFASSARPASPAPAPAAAAPSSPAASLRPSSRPRFASTARPASPAPAAAPASPAASLRPSSRPRFVSPAARPASPAPVAASPRPSSRPSSRPPSRSPSSVAASPVDESKLSPEQLEFLRRKQSGR